VLQLEHVDCEWVVERAGREAPGRLGTGSAPAEANHGGFTDVGLFVDPCNHIQQTVDGYRAADTAEGLGRATTTFWVDGVTGPQNGIEAPIASENAQPGDRRTSSCLGCRSGCLA